MGFINHMDNNFILNQKMKPKIVKEINNNNIFNQHQIYKIYIKIKKIKK